MTTQNDLKLELETQYRNEEMMREYNDRSFEMSSSNFDDSQYFDPYYGDLREDPFGY